MVVEGGSSAPTSPAAPSSDATAGAGPVVADAAGAAAETPPVRILFGDNSIET